MQPDEYNPLPLQAHEFLDGRLAPEAEADFRRRMDDDADLRADVEKVHDALALLKTLPVKDPGVAFNERVMGRVRESELIDRARRRIRGARTPLWQHAAQVAAGAVAAALVLALTGVFGPAQTDAPVPPDLLSAAPTEDDLQPVLADQAMRLQRLTDHLGSLAATDGQAQRHLLRAELEYSGLHRRNLWLRAQAADLPMDRRREMQQYIEATERALAVLEQELVESAAADRQVEIGRVRTVLQDVQSPQTLTGIFHLSVRQSGHAQRTRVAPPEAWSAETRAYAAVREALYSNDNAAIAAACEAYLRPFGNAGKYARAVRLQEVTALIRLDRAAEAAQRYEQTFGVFEEKLDAADRLWLDRWTSQAEQDQLSAARKAARTSGD